MCVCARVCLRACQCVGCLHSINLEVGCILIVFVSLRLLYMSIKVLFVKKYVCILDGSIYVNKFLRDRVLNRKKVPFC